MNKIQVQPHEYSSEEFEIIDISQPTIFKYKKSCTTKNKSAILWYSYAILNDLGNVFNYCCRLKNNDPHKLTAFRFSHDPIKICKFDSHDSIENLRDIHDRMGNVANMGNYTEASAENALLAIGQNNNLLLNEMLDIFAKVGNLEEKIKSAINEEFNENFCKF